MRRVFFFSGRESGAAWVITNVVRDGVTRTYNIIPPRNDFKRSNMVIGARNPIGDDSFNAVRAYARFICNRRAIRFELAHFGPPCNGKLSVIDK